jgi:hypothetical protein
MLDILDITAAPTVISLDSLEMRGARGNAGIPVATNTAADDIESSAALGKAFP